MKALMMAKKQSIESEIGGYFGLELNYRGEYHPNAMKLNSGRNALKLVLSKEQLKHLYLPHYICNAVVQAVDGAGVAYEFYAIDQNFEPHLTTQPRPHSTILAVNYFGLQDHTVHRLAERYPNLIVDNSQAFYCPPAHTTATFYSPRKFFGVTDGGYLYAAGLSAKEFDMDTSFERYSHALIRLDQNAQAGYPDFCKNEQKIAQSPIRQMSKLTQRLLESIDYDQVKQIREQNFLYLHHSLGPYNELELNPLLNGPMSYPFLLQVDGLRKFLISKKIYIAQYWSEVLDRTPPTSFEYHLAKYLIPLPIDQRYGPTEMDSIIYQVKSFLNSIR